METIFPMFLPDRPIKNGRPLATAAIILPLALLCMACGGTEKGSGEQPIRERTPLAADSAAGATLNSPPPSPPDGIPASATIIDSARISLPGRPGRWLYLWSMNPKRYPREMPDEPYTCPEETRGSHYRGVIRLSLVDDGSHSIINTVDIGQGLDEADTFDIPYSIQSGLHYPVPGVAEGNEGRPALLDLRDYNGDGSALEVPFFDAMACMGLQTALFGYSPRQDRVIHYPVELSITSGEDTTSGTLLWIDRLFRESPSGKGRWQYNIDYRGRGGTLDSYDIRYDPDQEKFTGTLVSVSGE